MIVEKIIITTEKQELNITGATLLSIEEYRQCKDLIPRVNKTWWLRSAGYDVDLAACVFGEDGNVGEGGFRVFHEFGVRPALTILNLESSNLQIGDKFTFAGHIFTVISDTYALCDDIIGECDFRENWRAKNSNNYETSDVKKRLENWYSNQVIEAESEE